MLFITTLWKIETENYFLSFCFFFFFPFPSCAHTDKLLQGKECLERIWVSTKFFNKKENVCFEKKYHIKLIQIQDFKQCMLSEAWRCLFWHNVPVYLNTINSNHYWEISSKILSQLHRFTIRCFKKNFPLVYSLEQYQNSLIL